MSKITIVEGNSNEKDNVRLLVVKGEKGENNVLTIGEVTTAESSASASITGDSPNQVLNLGLPKGDPNTLTIGTVGSGTTASATITGDSPNQTLNLVLPKGDKGDKGDTGDVNLSQVFYQSGEHYTPKAKTCIPGYITDDGEDIYLSFVTPKRLDNIDVISCSSLKLSIYGINGLIGTARNDYATDVSPIIEYVSGLDNTYNVHITGGPYNNFPSYKSPVTAYIEQDGDVNFSLSID